MVGEDKGKCSRRVREMAGKPESAGHSATQSGPDSATGRKTTPKTAAGVSHAAALIGMRST
ncbi:hypothetical protein [Ruegeria sp. THAF33]|uniref:hypothetical protein n=1 Tax=Ruegeria sp. THAF33 TaxID=2587853 RepID=UPI001C12C3F4|nr:hypothetical protein [Ruegeria sp. THAF33]